MTISIQPYLEQLPHWPQSGCHILAQFDEESIIVYQAYRPSIARFAVEHQQFGGEFSYSRMSWIKPNFLWMMFRSGWAAKEGQEHILAVRLQRRFFDEVLASAVASTFAASGLSTHEDWQSAVAKSDVRLQWDPDHDPLGHCVERRAVQLGLRGEMLRHYGQDALLGIEDITSFVIEQRDHLSNGFTNLQTPTERVYQPSTAETRLVAGIDT
ncbi:MAG: DUF4291 domain-containing protein [Verrucomicrobiaceae bacterium]